MSWKRRALACAIVGAVGLAVASSAAAASGVQIGPGQGPGHPLIGRHKVSDDTVTSSNWSGYAVEAPSGSKFTSVTGTWTEPSVTCSGRSAQYAAFWAGIDGYSSDSVEQTGAMGECGGRSASYYAWYEMYPAGSVELSTRTYPVKPGDVLTSKVSVSGSTFTLTLVDSGRWTFTTAQSGSGLAQSSAEVIAEAPSSCGYTCRVLPLADFGTVSFSNAEAALNSGPLSPFGDFTYDNGPHDIIAETSNGTVKAQPSALNGGDAFTDTWNHS